MITESGGGLEHKNSTVLMTNRWATRTRRAYLSWLQLASHEYFHAWNIKRLRPAELGPFDYDNENITRSLWIAEGFTDYYADLQVLRAGLQTRDEYLDDLSSTIELLQTTPGRLVQSAEMASFDAWIKYYRPDENSNQHLRQLLHQGHRHRVSSRRDNSQGDQRRQVPRRCDATGVMRSSPGRRATRRSSFGA
jgi:predicted metalloprotease with PDZ domain